MATTRVMGQKAHERAKAIRNSIQRQKNKENAAGRKSISEQQAIERLGLRNLSPRSKKRVIRGQAPVAVANMSLENYGAMVLKAYQETQAEKIQAAYRGMRNRKKVRKMRVNQRKMKVNQLENKEKKLLQRRNLLQQQDRIRGELNAMSPNSPSPPRARSYINNPVYTKKMLELRARAKNPSPQSPRQARYYNKLKQLYTTGRAKKVAKKVAKKARVERIEKRRVKRKRPRQAQKPRKKKKPTSSPTIAQIQRNMLAANSPTIAQIQRNLQIKKRYTLTDLISGKKKTFTKKGWYDRAVAKQQSLRVRICAA